ncbi:MAG: TIGR03790 family protein [Phycisphaerae bacterium]|nr:TIGR03790 family protein [Phycisphaerae bacterium]MDD5380264.1 TIGR03790 family protein [Phycisphaerae bacterium]
MKTILRKLITGWFLVYILCSASAFALEPDEILVIANSDIEASVQLAQYYCAKRGVPAENILTLPLGASLNDTIDRNNYKKQLVEPICKKLADFDFAIKIKCLLTTYGVPIKVGKRGQLKNQQDNLTQLKNLAEQEKTRIEQLKHNGTVDTPKKMKDAKLKLAQLQVEIDHIIGKETDASVDSELSMVLFSDYELYRWQPNRLKDNSLGLYTNTLMVSRLDGPSFEIAKGLIDKAIMAEKTGLRGIVYIDSRGRKDNKNPYSYGHFDQSLRDLAALTRLQTGMTVEEERTEKLFEPNSCPQTAIYCGWYSLGKYVDAFDFVPGAIGYHVSSWEAVDLRDPNSSQWCPAMLKDGATVTLGPVAEPYLHTFPPPKDFFQELFNGRCLVEAYYRTNPFNSWQMVLIGDPLYKPFKNRQSRSG